MAKNEGQENRRRIPRWVYVVVVLVVGAGILTWRLTRPRTVEVVQPEARTVVQMITASGLVRGVQFADLAPEQAGVLTDLLVEEGEKVSPGQVVARVSSRVASARVEEARAAVSAAEAQVAEAQANAASLPPLIQQTEAEVNSRILQAREQLAQARAQLDQLRRGGTVEEKREAQASLEQAELQVAQAERDLEDARRLAESDQTARANLESSLAALQQAQAQVSQAQARVRQTKRDFERAEYLFSEGATSSASMDAAFTTYEDAQERLQQAEAAAAQRAVEVDRQEKLLEVTRETEVERAQNALSLAQRGLEAAQARWDRVSGPARPELIAQQEAAVRRAETALAEAEEAGPLRLRTVELTPARERVILAEENAAQARAALATALAQAGTTEVTSPYAAVVTSILRRPGDSAGPAQPVLSVSQLEFPEVRVDIDERDIAEVEVGQEAILVSDVHPEQDIPAQVVAISPRTDTERGVVEVVLVPSDPVPGLRAGMTVDVSIIVVPASKQLVIPTPSVVRSGEEAFVEVVEEGTVVKRNVELGKTDEVGAVVTSGLGPGDLVVKDPLGVPLGAEVNAVSMEEGEGSDGS